MTKYGKFWQDVLLLRVRFIDKLTNRRSLIQKNKRVLLQIMEIFTCVCEKRQSFIFTQCTALSVVTWMSRLHTNFR